MLVNFHVTADQAAVLDAKLAALRARNPGVKVTRSDVIRAAILAEDGDAAPPAIVQPVANCPPRMRNRVR